VCDVLRCPTISSKIDVQSTKHQQPQIDNAEAALILAGSEVDGRPIKVEFARPRGSGGRRGGGGGSNAGKSGGGSNAGKSRPAPPDNSVYVGNLPWSVLSEDLSRILGVPIDNVEVQMGRDGRSRGYGLVSCTSSADAQALIAEWDGQDMDGREIVVRSDRG
jgi:RNA recognition motif-containing protein